MIKKMKAVGLYEHLSIDQENSLLDLEIEKPNPGDHDLLVRVKAIGVNPIDYKMRKAGKNKEEEPKILGWDASAIVEEVGPSCTLFKVGDEVYYAGDITRPGANSEFHVIDERIVGRKPSSLSFTESAALPLTTITAYESLFKRLAINKNSNENKGKAILIIGASGGVGSMATQLAKNVGLTVIGTASRPESIEWTKDHGSDFTINHHHDFKSQLEEMDFKYVDFILCLNDTDQHWENMAEVIAPQGKICSIVENVNPVKLGLLKDKSVTFVWESMFTRSKYKTVDMIEQHNLLNEVADLVDAKILKTTINEKLSPINAENLKRAHAMLESGKSIGKIVIEQGD